MVEAVSCLGPSHLCSLRNCWYKASVCCGVEILPSLGLSMATSNGTMGESNHPFFRPFFKSSWSHVEKPEPAHLTVLTFEKTLGVPKCPSFVYYGFLLKRWADPFAGWNRLKELHGVHVHKVGRFLRPETLLTKCHSDAGDAVHAACSYPGHDKIC